MCVWGSVCLCVPVCLCLRLDACVCLCVCLRLCVYETICVWGSVCVYVCICVWDLFLPHQHWGYRHTQVFPAFLVSVEIWTQVFMLAKQRLVPPWLHIGFGEGKDFLTVTWSSSGWSTNLREPPASAFPILGLKVYSTMLAFYMGIRDQPQVLTLTQALNQLSCLPAWQPFSYLPAQWHSPLWMSPSWPISCFDFSIHLLSLAFLLLWS